MEKFTEMMAFSLQLISAIAFTVAAPVFGKTIVDKTVVTVNNDVILSSDIDEFKERVKSKSYQELFGVVPAETLSNRTALINLLIEERLINQQVKKLELEASEQEVEGQIRSIAKRNGITQAQLQERLKQLGTSIPEYKTAIKRQLERKNLIDREIKPTLDITEEQLRHHYQRSSLSTQGDQSYRIAHILIDNRTKDGLKAVDRAQSVWKVVQAKPDEFPKFVAEYSDDASSVESAGVLGEFPASQLSKEFKAEVLKTPVGKVGKPVKTAAGYHIIKVIEKKVSDFGSLSKEQKEMLRGEVISAELEKKMAMWLDRRKSESYIKVIEHEAK